MVSNRSHYGHNDMDSTQLVFNFAMASLGALALFILNSVWGRLGKLEVSDTQLAAEIAKLSILVAGEYVKRDEVEKLGTAIFAKLDRIENKLDGKADKQ